MAVASIGGTPTRARPRTKPELARLILTATGFAVSAIMVGWLLLAPKAVPAGSGMNLLGFALARAEGRPAEVAPRILLGQPVRTLSGLPDLESALDQKLRARPGEPIVLGYSGVGAIDNHGRAVMVPEGASLADEADLVPVDELVRALEAKLAAAKTPALLLFDLVAVDSSRRLLAPGNGFLAKLKLAIESKPPEHLAILTAAAPGQAAAVSDTDSSTVFGAALAREIDEAANDSRRITASELATQVRERVHAWVMAHRDGSVQTPLWLSGPRIDFTLRADAIPRAEPGIVASSGATDVDKERIGRFEALWAAAEVLRGRKAYRRAPGAWHALQENLLTAEQMMRLGREADALKLLDAADGHRREIEALLAGQGDPESRLDWSLALLDQQRAQSAPADASRIGREIEAYRRAIGSALVRGDGLPAATTPPPAEPSAPPQPAASEPGGRGPYVQETTQTDKAQDSAPKAEEAEKGEAKKTEEAQPKAKEAVAPEPGPLPLPTLERSPGVPRYVEGQLAAWYQNYVELGAETPQLQESREALLQRASEIRERLEAAAACAPEAIGWVRPLVEAADQTRRRAVDRLFAADRATVEGARALLDQAEQQAEEAFGVRDQVEQAVDAIARTLDLAPYLAEWLAHREGRPSERISTLLAQATVLSGLVSQPPSSGRGEEAGRLRTLGAEVAAHLGRLETEHRSHLGAVAFAGEKRSWSQIDALLRVPLTASATGEGRGASARTAVLAILKGEPGIETAPDPAGTPDSGSPPDPRAQGASLSLARVIHGLTDVARGRVDTPRSLTEAERDPSQPLDGFAAEARDRLARAFAPIAPGATPAATLSAVSTASWMARVAGGSIGPQGDLPARALDDALRLWHAERLLGDYAPEHARDILGSRAPRATAWEPQWTELVARAARYGQSRVIVKAEPAKVPAQYDITFGREGSFPEGDAVLVAGSEPGQPPARLRGMGDRGNLLLPIAADGPRDASIVASAVGGAFEATVFYRGRDFRAGSLRPPLIDRVGLKLVKLDPKGNPVDVTDRRIALHPQDRREYRVVATNNSGEPLTLVITRQTESEAPLPLSGSVQVAAGQSVEVTDSIASDELDFAREKRVSYMAREAGANGTPLGQEAVYSFRKVDLRQYVDFAPGWDTTGLEIPRIKGLSRPGERRKYQRLCFVRIPVEVIHRKSDPAGEPIMPQIFFEPANLGFLTKVPPRPLAPGETGQFEFYGLGSDAGTQFTVWIVVKGQVIEHKVVGRGGVAPGAAPGRPVIPQGDPAAGELPAVPPG